MMIKTKIENKVAEIILNRPDKRNALNTSMVSELIDAFTVADKNPDVKLILLKAEGDVFSAGADLVSLKQLQSATLEENIQDSSHLSDLFRLIYFIDKPIIGAVHGHAIAGGCGLVTLCDISIVQIGAKLGYTETRIGFVPALVSKFLLEKTGLTTTLDLLLSGRLIDAEEAERIKLVTEAVDVARFDERVRYYIEMLLTKTSGEALKLTKQIIRAAANEDVITFLNHAVTMNAKARSGDDCKRGIEAFLNKETITW